MHATGKQEVSNAEGDDYIPRASKTLGAPPTAGSCMFLKCGMGQQIARPSIAACWVIAGGGGRFHTKGPILQDVLLVGKLTG